VKKTVSGGGVVVNKQGQVLVVNQKGTSWSLPKGKIEPGEDVLAAAKREIYEETGVAQLTLVKELGTYSRYKIAAEGGEDTAEHKTITFFLFMTDQLELQPHDDDNPQALWLDPKKVEELLTHPKDKAFYRKVMHELAHL
jgi:8-oxo-dGTP pyrophosphatase MutT (NUDIX family)